MRVDLNADIGEGSISDESLLRAISSGSIACGYHAGDPTLMRTTVRLAARAGVAIGAHPGFADRADFGRREIEVEASAIEDLVLYQVGALAAIAHKEGLRLRHVKPHGALYHLGARKADVADAIARAVAAFDRSLVLVGLPGSMLLSAAVKHGLAAATEAFADRAYEADGSLTPRSIPGSVLKNREVLVARALQIVREGTVVARDGSTIRVPAQTLCIHSDTPDAAELAHALRVGLEAAGVRVAAFSEG